MKIKRAIVGLVFGAMGLVTGCAPMAITGSAKVDKTAFAPKKTYALVTIAAEKEIIGGQSTGQLLTKNENIEGLNTQPILEKLVPIVREKFAKTGFFTSMPAKKILASKAYKRSEEDERIVRAGLGKYEFIPGKGYKYFKDPQKLAALAKELGVDGVVCVQMLFTVKAEKGGFYLGPLNLGKKEYRAGASVSVVAYDKTGKEIWRDTTMKDAAPGDERSIVGLDFSDFKGTNYLKLHPTAVLIASYASDVLIERFQDTMAGKKTSSFQKMREKKATEATKTKS